jgi:hypothetical protein
MAVRVLALTFVIAEIVAGGEIRLDGNFVHLRLLDPVGKTHRTVPILI